MYLLGVDLSLEWFDVVMLDSCAKEIFSRRFDSSQDGFDALFEKIRSNGIPFEEVCVALENPHHPIVLACMARQMTVYAINPKTIDRARDRYHPGGTKSDRFDAFVLADFLRTDGQRLSPLSPRSQDEERLAALSRDLQALQRTRQRIVNQLSQALDEAFPHLKKLFSDPYCRAAIEFLTSWPSLENAKRNFPRHSSRFFKRYLFAHSRRKEFLSLLREAHSLTPDLEQTRAPFIKALAEQLSLIASQIAHYQKELHTMVDNHPDCPIFNSLPAVGKTILRGLLLVFCSHERHFQNSRGLSAQAGITPVVYASGKSSRSNRFRHACQKPWRNIFTLWAMVSISPHGCPWARLYYEQLRTKGKSHYHALRIVASKLAKIAFACWRDKTLYDENRFLASKMEHLLRST